MYSFIQLVKGEYLAWTIYLVMEYIIWFSLQNGEEWAYTKLSTLGSYNTDNKSSTNVAITDNFIFVFI